MSGKERMGKSFNINAKRLKHAGGEHKRFLQQVA
jgi:hypothetical protein